MSLISSLAVHPEYLEGLPADAIQSILSDAEAGRSKSCKVVPLYPFITQLGEGGSISKDKSQAQDSGGNFWKLHLITGAIAFVLLAYFGIQMYLYKELQKVQSHFEKVTLERESKIATLESNISGLTDVAKFVVKRIGEVEAPRVLAAASTEVTIPSNEQELPAREIPNLIVSVTAPKANLRTGPGENFGALMTVARGSGLVVEDSKGGWLQVISPNGGKAWVLSSLVAVSEGEKL